MGIGLGVFLLVVGAILAFGVKTSLTDFDLTAIGYILIAGGVLVILLSLIVSCRGATRPEHRDQYRFGGASGSRGTRRPEHWVLGLART